MVRVVGGFGMRWLEPHLILGVNSGALEGLNGAHEVSHLEGAGCGGSFGHRPQSLGLDPRGHFILRHGSPFLAAPLFSV